MREPKPTIHYIGLISTQRANSEVKRKPDNQHVKVFLQSAKYTLKRTKKPVYIFCKFQLEKLKEEFGDRLIYEYDESNNWWVCRLKKDEKKKTLASTLIESAMKEEGKKNAN